MKTALIGVNGKAGSLIVKEPIARGHKVSYFVRNRKHYYI